MDPVLDTPAVQAHNHSVDGGNEIVHTHTHTPDDLVTVTPSLEADAFTYDEIPAGITTPVQLFLDAV